MTAADVLREIAARQIALVPALGLWTASVDINGEGHNRKRALRSVSAIGNSPVQAVRELVEKIDAEPTPQTFEFEECPF